MKVILYIGFRSEEICNLKIQHVNLNSGHTTIYNGKGAKDRVGHIKNDALTQLRKWVKVKEEHENEKFNESPYMFPTLKGTQLDTRYLRAVFKRYGEKAGIIKEFHYVDDEGKKERMTGVFPHLLRSTFASNYYRATRDIRGLQILLGHSSIQSVERYTYVYNKDIEENLEHFPDKKKKEHEAIEKIKELEEEIKKLKNGIDQNKLFDY